MSYRYRLPLLTDQLLSEIIFGMENQDVDYVLDLKTGTLYIPGSDDRNPPDGDDVVNLPPWTSSDGYEVMVAFTNACSDRDLKKKLSSELSSRQKGVFRRFRDVLAEDPDVLNRWYDFKDRRMKSFIRSWFRSQFSRNMDGLEEGDDVQEGELLSDFEVCHLKPLDDYCKTLLDSVCEGNPVKKKIFDAFSAKEAFVVKKDACECGAIIYETVGNEACILYYQVDENLREMGLFSLMFDLFNREMERSGVEKVIMPFSTESAFLKQSLTGHELGLDMSDDNYMYKVEEWTGNNASSEYAYVL
ncbi:MAG: hypothetical protein IJ663_08190 [Spirochaetales bacterium]|nr:hypothetical protein [Spirochaetales bacterium]